MILRRERRDRFTIVDNVAIEDGRLSYKAVGILVYLLSRPDGWAANYRQLSTVHDDGEHAVRSGLEELRSCGYLEQRRRKHPETGQWVWECIIRERPVEKPVGDVDDERSPCGGFPGMGNPGVGNHRSSKDGEAKTEKQPPKPPRGGRSRARPPEPLTTLERDVDFDTWWAAYPRKIAKLEAVKAWRQMLGHLPRIEQLVAASELLRDRTQREHHNDAEWERFLPHPATWLRRGQFLDTLEQTRTARNPCVLCGVVDPSQATCQGPARGVIDDVGECVWKD